MDAENVDQFQKASDRLVSEGVLCVVADLTGLEYVSSMGLRAIMSAAKALQERSGSLILCGLRGVPRQVFVMTNLLSLFPVFETSAEALATL
jgi:anti-sigma B factor antagonist